VIADDPPDPVWWAHVTLEYEGTRFAGSQYQPGQRTVQGTIEDAVHRLTGEWQRITLAGRTDTGVHASGQVASLVVPARFTPAAFARGLNALLPPDVAAVSVRPVRPGFHARFAALSRSYAYSIWNGPFASPLRRTTSWHVRATLDVAAMRAAGAALVGAHNFASFAGAGRGVAAGGRAVGAPGGTVTELTTTVAEETAHGRLIRLTITAPSFLPHMVRNIAGALVAVGRGAWPVAAVAEVLAAADRRRAPATAPPEGVMLERIVYDEAWYTDTHPRGAVTDRTAALLDDVTRTTGLRSSSPPRATGARE
jgi:tRNA pseudouridine38-40 synthase